MDGSFFSAYRILTVICTGWLGLASSLVVVTDPFQHQSRSLQFHGQEILQKVVNFECGRDLFTREIS